jgi:hypothetical protein
MEHTKYYNDIKVAYEQLIKKSISYANPTEEVKNITVTSLSPYIKIKQQHLKI